MKITTTYSVYIKHYNSIFKQTVSIYRQAVDFFIGVLMENTAIITGLKELKAQKTAVERLTVRTSGRPVVPYDFAAADKCFYKFPSYLRRAAIAEAVGKVSSYLSNLANWESSDPGSRGKRPGYPKAGYVYPALYKDNMFTETDDPYTFRIKIYIRGTWDWLMVDLRKSDVDYIRRRCSMRKRLSPTLQKRGRKWSLDFPFEENVPLSGTAISEQTVIAVDLGINSACVCTAMGPDGTVFGRHFLRLPKENDCLAHAVNRVKKAQRLGAKRTPRLWAKANGINDDIAVKTAEFIIDTAVLYNADVIVFEYLELRKKKRGSKRQRLHLWKAEYVQSMVTDKAHRLKMRVSRVNAWNTSRLAFDGSGRVLRGKESAKTDGNYSLCEFSTGKVYNCDLNASYNIGARYFIREILKSLPVTARLRLEAKVPQVRKRSTCTLSDLISLGAEIAALAAA